MYIGRASNLKNRKRTHFRKLKGKHHWNQHLQRAFERDGKNNFCFFIIEYCKKEKLSEKERQYIRIFDTYKNGYNMTMGGEGMLGFHHSEKTKTKLSKYFKNNPSRKPGDYRHSEKTKRKISETRIENEIAKGKNNPMYGVRVFGKNNSFYNKKHTDETKSKISEKNSGKNHPMYGKTHSIKTKQEMSTKASGEGNSQSKLNNNDVLEILDLYYNKGYKQSDIALLYPTNSSNISIIVNGKAWKDCYKEFFEKLI
jgi:hypothetical protein